MQKHSLQIGAVIGVIAAVAVTVSAADAKAKRPTSKWLTGVRGHEKALEEQKQNGADMVVFFFRDMPKDEKGLHRWFRKETLNSWPVNKLLQDYIKVEILVSDNDRKVQPLLTEYFVKKTPRFVVRRPDGWKERVDCFNWSGRQPDPLKPEEFVKRVQAVSSQESAP